MSYETELRKNCMYGELGFTPESPLGRALDMLNDDRLSDHLAFSNMLAELGVTHIPGDTDEARLSKLYDVIEENLLGPLSSLMSWTDREGRLRTINQDR